MAEIERRFKCNCKEVSITHNGISYLVICGKHINGAYCAFPKLNVAVELSGYDGDYGYNEKKLHLAFTGKEDCIGNDTETSTRVRLLRGKGIYAIASVTIDYELTINDIKVFRQGADFNLRFPNTENAKQNNQFSIHADEHIYKEIKAAVLRQIDSLL